MRAGRKEKAGGTETQEWLRPFSELPPCVPGAFTHTLLSRMFSAISLSTVRVDFTESLIGPSNPCAPRMSMISGHDQHKYKNAVHACVQSMTQHMHETWIVCVPRALAPQPQRMGASTIDIRVCSGVKGPLIKRGTTHPMRIFHAGGEQAESHPGQPAHHS